MSILISTGLFVYFDHYHRENRPRSARHHFQHHLNFISPTIHFDHISNSFSTSFEPHFDRFRASVRHSEAPASSANSPLRVASDSSSVETSPIRFAHDVWKWMAGWLDDWMAGCLDAWMPGCLDAWMPGCLDGWMGRPCTPQTPPGIAPTP